MRAAADTDDRACKRDPRDFALWKGDEARRADLADPLGPAAVPAGTWSARRWPPSTSGRPSTSTAAASTWSSRTTRTSSPSPRRPATASPATGCTTACSRSAREKMSKSLGNSLLIPEMVQKVRPVELRYYLAAPHYRSADRLLGGGAAGGRGGLPAHRGLRDPGGGGHPRRRRRRPAARRRSSTRSTTTSAPRRRSPSCTRWSARATSRWPRGTRSRSPGCWPRPRTCSTCSASTRASAQWRAGGGSDLKPVVDALVAVALEQRQAARARKDYAAADAIRDQLAGAGHRGGGHPAGPAGSSAASVRHELAGGPSTLGAMAAGKSVGQAREEEGPVQGHRRAGAPRARGQGRDPACRNAPLVQGQGPRRAHRPRGPRRRPAPRRGQAASAPRTPPNTSAAATPSWRPCAPACPANALYVAQRLENDDRVRDAVRVATERGIALLEVSRDKLDRLTEGAVHQGVALQIPAYDYAHPDDLVELAQDAAEVPLIVALDGVTDPRNLGAIARSATAFGAHGMLDPVPALRRSHRRAPGRPPRARWPTSRWPAPPT